MANGFGDVYVFNLYVSNITRIGLNGQDSAGTIAAPTPTSKYPYQPSQLAISRTNLTVSQLSSSLFVQGDNTLTVNYFGESWTATITIGDKIKSGLQYDLWLYVCYQTAWLFDTFGNEQSFYCQQYTKMIGGKEIIFYGYTPPPFRP